MNKLKLKVVVSLLIFFCFLPLTAQDVVPDILSRQYGVSLKAGTTGIGLEGSTNINFLMNLRAGINYTRFGFDIPPGTVTSADEIGAHIDVNLNSYTLFLDIYPFTKFGIFHVTTGLALNYNNVNLNLYATENIEYNNREYTPEEIGEIDINVRGNLLNPYLGLGFGNALPKKRVGVNFEFGALYTGKPHAEFTASGQVEPTASEENERQLEKNNDDLTFYPVVSLQLNVRIK